MARLEGSSEDAWLADEVGREHLGSSYQRGAQVARVTGLLGIGSAVGLALAHLWLPFVAAGASAILLATYLTLAMPEVGFNPAPRSQQLPRVGTIQTTAHEGARVVRQAPLPVPQCVRPGSR